MRLVKLGLGWLAICALTAAGSYYGAIELDQDLGLQAKLCPSCAAGGGPVTPPVSSPGNGSPSQGNPGSTGSTGGPDNVSPVTNPNPPVATPPPSQYTPTPAPARSNPPQPGYPAPSYPTNPPPQRQPQYQPPVQSPIQRPPTQAPAPGVDVSGLVVRYNALLDRANAINNEFGQIERDLKSQGQSLRGDIQSARQTMIQSMNGAAAALRAKDGSTASRLMQKAEQEINFLEQSR
ncbi:MAG TPA: hypothetical protein VME43_13545 [Bryobacteraceae bacterium]|nr:hypothetical protein [Bryobacteraceae bacterium]